MPRVRKALGLGEDIDAVVGHLALLDLDLEPASSCNLLSYFAALYSAFSGTSKPPLLPIVTPFGEWF